jgi:hypothetical protein
MGTCTGTSEARRQSSHQCIILSQDRVKHEKATGPNSMILITNTAPTQPDQRRKVENLNFCIFIQK